MSSLKPLDVARYCARPVPLVLPRMTMPSHCFKQHVGKPLEHLVLRLKGEASTFSNAKALAHLMGGRTVDPSVADNVRRTTDRYIGWGLRKLNGFKAGGELSPDRIAEVDRVLTMLRSNQAITPEMLRAEGYDLVLSKAYRATVGGRSGELTAFLDLTGSADISVIRTTQDLQNLNANVNSIQELVSENCSLWKFGNRDLLQAAGKDTLGNPQEQVVLNQALNAKNVAVAVAVVAVIVTTALFTAKAVSEEVTASDAVKYAIDLAMIGVGYAVATSAAITTAAATAGISLLFLGVSVALHALVDAITSFVAPELVFHSFEIVPFATYFGPSLFSLDQKQESQFAVDARPGAHSLSARSALAQDQRSSFARDASNRSAFAQDQRSSFARDTRSRFT